MLATFVANISPEPQPALNPLEKTLAAAKKPPVSKSTDKAPTLKQPAAAKKVVTWAKKLESFEPTIEKDAQKFLQQVNGHKKPEKPILKTPTKTPKKVSIKIVEETKKTAAPEKVSKYSLKSKEALYEKVGPTKSKAVSALEAAAVKIEVLKANKIIPQNLSEDAKKSLLEITAKAIESRAAKAQQIISKPNNQINVVVLKENYQRHTRCDFNGVDFSAAFMNSFANCKFTGNCNFGNSTINKPKFVNCVFDNSLSPEQAKEISKLDPQNLIGCKFGENFVKSLGGNAEQEAFKKSLGIKGKANSEGFYEVPKPYQILKPLSVFQLKVPTQSKSF